MLKREIPQELSKLETAIVQNAMYIPPMVRAEILGKLRNVKHLVDGYTAAHVKDEDVQTAKEIILPDGVQIYYPTHVSGQMWQVRVVGTDRRLNIQATDVIYYK